MFIEIAATPNPATMKFVPDTPLFQGGEPVVFNDQIAARQNPLAESLFEMQGVAGVLIAPDFISVTKDEAASRPELEEKILAFLTEWLSSGQAVLAGEVIAEAEDFAPEDAETVAQIKEILDTRLRPAVAQDGGDIIFRGYRNGVVFLSMRGACNGCPSSQATLKMGAENLLKYFIPEILGVQAVA